MAHDQEEVKEFLHKTLSKRKSNAVFSLAVMTTLLLTAALHGHTITDAASSRPSSDAVFYWLDTTLARLEREFRAFVENFLHAHWRGIRRQLPYLLVDETHESYTGKKKSIWIHKYKHEAGDTGSFKFLTFALVGPVKRLVVNVVPLRKREKSLPHIIETICWLRQHVKFRLVIFDRGFYDGNLVRALNDLGVKYLIRVRIWAEVRCMLESCKGWTALEHRIGAKRGKEGVATTLVLGKDNKGPWAFVTNACPQQIWRLRNYYRKRWNIENTFKVCDGIRLPTNSTRIELKLLFFLFSCVVYNVWQQLRRAQCAFTLRRCAKKIRKQLIVSQLGEPPPALAQVLGLIGV